MSEKAVIIGAGQAGAQAAASLRQEGFAGPITLIGEEHAAPYQRPPLSKAYLQGEMTGDRLLLKPDAFYAKHSIELRLGERVAAIDRVRRTVALQQGEAIAYDKLLIATGAPPRRLPCVGADLENVRYLRTQTDSDALRPHLAAGRRIVVIGAGYIGLEAAASARKAGLEVTVVEAKDRALERVAGLPVSRFFEELHRARGVDLRFSACVERLEGKRAVEGVALAGGEIMPCDSVLVGIGASPAVSLAEEAGLPVDDGVLVDEASRTADEAIWAAGDCANFPSPLYGRRMRLESVPNAIEQAKVAAASMAGRDVVYDAVPWFWSDQYDAKLQTAGVGQGADQLVVRRGHEMQISVWYLKEGRLLAVDAVNDTPAFAIGKRLIAARATPSVKILADPAADLKSLLS